MPFPSALSAPQITTIRESGYWQTPLVCLNPNDVVFRAQASETIDAQPFITFTWDNADVGAFGDVLEGMVCYISATTSIRDAKYRGRVRLAPSSTEFFIDENATILNDGDYVIVTRDADLFARVRRDTLVDGSITYHNLPPMIAALPSVLCLYDADNDGFASYTAVQTGVATASGATISSWLWTISGAGSTSFTSGTSTSQNPTIRFQAGFHYLVRCRVTDSNGVQMFQFVQVYVIARYLTAPANTSIVTGSIDNDLDSGYTASLTAYADVSTLVDRTHCAVFMIERFGDNSSTPIVTNILMNGRIRSDSIQTAGSDVAGQDQFVTFAVEGMTAYLQRLRIPSDIIRATASPDEWGEITDPNPFRMAVYAMWVYTTLPNICSFSAETGNFDDWRTGAEPVAIDGGYASDVLNGILWDRIKAQPNYAPSGEIFLARNLNFLEDRSGVVTVMDFELEDMRDFTIDRDSSRVTAQVVAYGGVFVSSSNQIVLYTAQSPSIVYGDAPETQELTRELLAYDSTASEAATEISSRAGNFYAFNNPKPLLNVVFYDAVAWLQALNFRRYTFTIPASDNTLGIAYTDADNWFCQRVSLALSTDGSIEVSAEFPAETEFSDAQQMAALLPNNLEGLNPVLPVLPNDPAFPVDPLEIYPNDAPGIDDLQPIGGFSAGQAFTPFPPDIAADMTERQGKAGCFTMGVNFRNSSNTASVKTTSLGDDYLISLSGSSAYSLAEWQQTFNFVTGEQGWALSALNGGGSYAAGQGWLLGNGFGTSSTSKLAVIKISAATTLTYISLTYNLTKGTYTNGTIPAVAFGIWSGANETGIFTQLATLANSDAGNGNGQTFAWSGSQAIGSTRFALRSSDNGAFGGTGLITSVTLRGTGVNPFSGNPAVALSCDAFYTFDPADTEGITAQLYSASEGLRLDNAAVSAANTPPFSANHNYQIPFTGTNNTLLARMAFDSYTAKQNRLLNIEVCRVTT